MRGDEEELDNHKISNETKKELLAAALIIVFILLLSIFTYFIVELNTPITKDCANSTEDCIDTSSRVLKEQRKDGDLSSFDLDETIKDMEVIEESVQDTGVYGAISYSEDDKVRIENSRPIDYITEDTKIEQYEYENSKYIGTMKDDKPYGINFRYTDSGYIIGEFIGSELNGYGVCKIKDSTDEIEKIILGNFTNGVLNGPGVLKINTNIYIGEFKDGQISKGENIYIKNDNNEYIGRLEQDFSTEMNSPELTIIEQKEDKVWTSKKIGNISPTSLGLKINSLSFIVSSTVISISDANACTDLVYKDEYIELYIGFPSVSTDLTLIISNDNELSINTNITDKEYTPLIAELIMLN